MKEKKKKKNAYIILGSPPASTAPVVLDTKQKNPATSGYDANNVGSRMLECGAPCSMAKREPCGWCWGGAFEGGISRITNKIIIKKKNNKKEY